MQHLDIASLERTPSLADILANLDRTLPARQATITVDHPTLFPVRRTHRKVAHK